MPEPPSAEGRSGTALQRPRVLVMLCTYNERSNLPAMLSALHATLPQADLLVVDDNSPDGTGQWALQQRAAMPALHVLMRAGKLGLGSALRDGMQWSLERSYDFLINLDADQSHDPQAVPQVLSPSLADMSRSTVTIGSRYVPGGASTGLSRPRQRLSRWLNWYASRQLRLPIADCSGSYRCYPMRLLSQVNWSRLTCNGYGFLEELLVALDEVGAQFQEVPITYHLRGGGESKLGLSDAWGAIWVISSLSRQRRAKR